jgi:hypothetical protein
MQFDGTTGGDNTTVFASTGGLPWPSPILPDTSYLFYLDLDDDPTTGGDPSSHGFPSTTQVAQQGIEIVVEIAMSGDCTSSPCTVELTLTVYEYDTSINPADYVEVYTDVAQIKPVSISLYQETGGAEPLHEERPLGVNLSATIPNQVLLNAGWQVGTPVNMQVAASVSCVTTLPNGTSGDCQCLDCANCPSYPGCYEDGSGIPEKQGVCSVGGNPCSTNGECAGGADICVFGDLVSDEASGVVDFEPPDFPYCTAEPSPVAQDGIVTITASDFPVLPGSIFEVRMGSADTTTPSYTTNGNGDVVITETVPADADRGDLRIAVVLQGFATAAHCYVCNDPDGTDFDSDGLCDVTDVDKDNDGQTDTQDTDDDNDGVLDADDPDPSNPYQCGDANNDGCDDCSVGICNHFPIVGEIIGPIEPLTLELPVDVSADFSDADTEDDHVASWDWGDGESSDGDVTEENGSKTVTGNHTYLEPGVYTVELTVTDSAGGVGTAVFQYVVVYDPSAGFVTGGGWIDSPAGAYAADPALTGKANFGFVSKYKKGAAVPTGNTEFKFHAADLNFHSSDYEWLVVAGAKGQFKGTGAINGAGNFGFMVFTIDAALTPSTDVDLFRIKIWDKDAGDLVVYDNEMGGADDADPTTQIGGGSIVIHKAKAKK